MDWIDTIGAFDPVGCKSYTVKDNIFASAWHAGVRLPARKCGEPAVHTGNVAHSISGYGFIVKEAAAGSCSEFGDVKGYKNRIATVHMGGGLGAPTNMISNIVTVDSNIGLMAFGVSDGYVEVKDSTFYGNKDM